MKFLRTSTRAIFYDYPLALAVNVLSPKKGYGSFLRYIGNIIKRIDPNFTDSEINQLIGILNDDWINDNSLKDDKTSTSNTFEDQLKRSFLILLRCGKEFLDIVNDSPVVKFSQLLRWRELTLLIGEDIITLAALADSDLTRGYTEPAREDFFWPDILNHDNKELNQILDKGLTDTHAHLLSSGDNFVFNWISLMNNEEQLKNCSNHLTATPIMQEYDPIYIHSDINLTLKQWCIVAANIRCLLFCSIYGYDEIKGRTLKRIKNFFNYTKAEESKEEETATDSSLEIESTITDLANDLAILKSKALKANNGCVFDYAIPQKINSYESQYKNPYLVHYGERSLMYKTFFKIFSHKIDGNLAILFYLYLLIKNKVRREFIHTNENLGFLNFQKYDLSKHLIVKDEYKELQTIYAVQSSLYGDSFNFLEARICPNELDRFIQKDYSSSIFPNMGTEDPLVKKKINLSFVVHFLKSDGTTKRESDCSHPKTYRFYSKREKLWSEMDTLLKYIDDNQKNNLIVGIDVAGSELKIRPEIFAPMFRWARFCGIRNFTYHAGEDFYDILDGLRTINELMMFMEYRAGDRIGHALALGRDVKEYYRSHDYILLIPRQILLDNLIWMKFYAMSNNISLQPQTNFFIEKNVSQLLSDIGYEYCTHYDYWRSMTLRGDDIINKKGLSARAQSYIVECEYNRQNPASNISRDLYYKYETVPEIQERGSKAIEIKVNSAYVADIEIIQKHMLIQLIKSGIIIETNPSSNCKIGGIKKYINHPIFNFHRPDGKDGRHLAVSVNTDDRGVFFTNLRNEFSLLAIAMKKELTSEGQNKYTMHEICQYISKLIEYGKTTKFDPIQVRLPNLLDGTDRADKMPSA